MKIKSIFLIVLLFSLLAVSVKAEFYFSGYIYNASGQAYNVTNSTNVTLNIYQQPSLSPVIALTVLANKTGFFNLTVNNTYCDDAYSFKPLIRKFVNDTSSIHDLTLIGQSLPDFPYQEFSNLGSVNFYLREGATINISVRNASYDLVSFYYMIKDVKLGYPIETNFDSTTVTNVTVYVPADRNYSVMVFPSQSFPLSYNLNNLTAYGTPKHVDITFNTTSSMHYVSGNVTVNGAVNVGSIKTIAYLAEPGNIISQDHPLPFNMSAWSGGTDVYDNNTGYFNLSLPGSAHHEISIVLFAVAEKNGNYYGAFRNITLNGSTNPIGNFDLSLQPLLGSIVNISVDTSTGGKINITAKKVTFNILGNGSTVTNAHLEAKVDYSALCANCSTFTWMDDISPSGGNSSLPFLNYSIKKIAVYTPSFAPKKTTRTVDQLASGVISINLTMFSPDEIDAGETIEDTSLEVVMYKSSAECSVPYPAASCILFDATQFDQFSPLTVVMGGGKIDFLMRMKTTNISVKYVDVDMLASGPPDALFDSASSNATTGTALEQAWRFGSQGPEIYAHVLVGIPYGGNVDESAPISVLLNNLYDENWNKIWNASDNPNAENYATVSNGDYAAFNSSWFNRTIKGRLCSKTEPTADCYVNTTYKMIWLKIPHFSGLGPTVNSLTLGGVSLNSTANFDCTRGCYVYFNVTNENNTLYTLQNITLNFTTSVKNVINFTLWRYNYTLAGWEMNFSATNGTNTASNSTVYRDYNLTLFNASNTTLHQYRLWVNKSNTTTTVLNLSYAISGMNVGGVSQLMSLLINLKCVESWSCAAWSTCTAKSQSRRCIDANSCDTTDNMPALTQVCVESTTTTGGGGGAGGASGGVSTGSSGLYEQKTWTSIYVGETASLTTKNGELGVTTISFGVDKTAWGAWLKVQKLDTLDSSLADAFKGDVYANLEITKAVSLPNDILKNPKIEFKVAKAWLKEKKLDKKNVALFRYVEDKWTQLKTTVGEDDGTYIHYTAETPGFSYFIIGKAQTAVEEAKPVSEEAAEKPVAAAEVPTEAAGEAVTIEKEKAPAAVWPWVVIVLVVIAIIIGYWLWTKKKKGGK